MFRVAPILGGGLLLLAAGWADVAHAALILDAGGVPAGEVAAESFGQAGICLEKHRVVDRDPHFPSRSLQGHQESASCVPVVGFGSVPGNAAAIVVVPLPTHDNMVARVLNYYRLALPESAPTGILRPPRR